MKRFVQHPFSSSLLLFCSSLLHLVSGESGSGNLLLLLHAILSQPYCLWHVMSGGGSLSDELRWHEQMQEEEEENECSMKRKDKNRMNYCCEETRSKSKHFSMATGWIISKNHCSDIRRGKEVVWSSFHQLMLECNIYLSLQQRGVLR